MKRLLPILLLPMVFFSCQPEKNPDLFDPNVEVICVYTPRKIEDGSNASLIYQGILRTTDSLGIAYRSIFPFTFQEGADSIAQLVSKN